MNSEYRTSPDPANNLLKLENRAIGNLKEINLPNKAIWIRQIKDKDK